jgi:DNA-binding transcriptional LysR family regulator
MDRLEAMRTFVRVVESGGFSSVARELGTTQPTVSKAVARLEDALGTRLLNRTTRRLGLTDDGARFLEAARRALAAVEEAMTGPDEAPHGRLRVAIPVAFGRLQVLPRLRRFMDRHPGLELDLVLSDGFVDLVGEGVDLAVRVGLLPDSGLVARRIGTTERVTVGSPDYFARFPEPLTPGDLERHDCVVYTGLATGHVWHFEGPGGPLSVPVRGRLRANNSEAVREAVLAGLGIAVVPVWLLSREIDAGSARIVLRDFAPRPLPIHAVWPARRHLPAKVRAFADFLAAEFALDPWLSADALGGGEA